MDDVYLRTAARLTDAAGTVAESRLNTARYGTRTISRTAYTNDVAELASQANALVGAFGTARSRLARLTQTLGRSGTNAEWAELLSRELGDKITVNHKPIGLSTTQTYYFFVESIRISANPEVWELNLTGSNAAGQHFFTLDDDVFGELDGIAVLGW